MDSPLASNGLNGKIPRRVGLLFDIKAGTQLEQKLELKLQVCSVAHIASVAPRRPRTVQPAGSPGTTFWSSFHRAARTSIVPQWVICSSFADHNPGAERHSTKTLCLEKL